MLCLFSFRLGIRKLSIACVFSDFVFNTNKKGPFDAKKKLICSANLWQRLLLFAFPNILSILSVHFLVFLCHQNFLLNLFRSTFWNLFGPYLYSPLTRYLDANVLVVIACAKWMFEWNVVAVQRVPAAKRRFSYANLRNECRETIIFALPSEYKLNFDSELSLTSKLRLTVICVFWIAFFSVYFAFETFNQFIASTLKILLDSIYADGIRFSSDFSFNMSR